MPPSVEFATCFMTHGVLVNTYHRALSLRLRFNYMRMPPSMEFATYFMAHGVLMNACHRVLILRMSLRPRFNCMQPSIEFDCDLFYDSRRFSLHAPSCIDFATEFATACVLHAT